MGKKSGCLAGPTLQIALLLLLSPGVHGQSEIWHGVEFEHEVTPRWGYVLSSEYRRNADQASDGTYLLLAGINRALVENLSLTLAARYEIPRGDFQEFRLLADLNFSRALFGPFTLETRLRLQQDRPIGEDGTLRQVAFRQRAGLSTQLSASLNAITEYESRFRFDSRNEWSRNRYTFGLEWAVTPSFKLEAYYRIEDRINEGPDTRKYIYGLYADFVLPDDRAREWKYRRPFGSRVIF